MLKKVIHSTIFDETTVIAHQSQLFLWVRYLYSSEVREDFIFINIAEEVIKSAKCDEEAISQESFVKHK